MLKHLAETEATQRKCNHSVGLFMDYGACEIVPQSEVTTDIEKRFNKFYVADVSFFCFCPDCGLKLPHKEKYEDAVEMVQMP